MKNVVLLFLLAASVVLFTSHSGKLSPKFQATGGSAVAEVLEQLGDPPVNHKVDFSIPGVSVERGRDLMFRGITKKTKGGKTSKQSKHFVCTSCHNIQREDPDLSVSDPQARLVYAVENNLPYLPGTTLYGVVNRSSFYNGDYEKKYGVLVEKTRNNLREAIQLCAIECSQGRRLQDWELESVLAFLWTLALKLKDLNLDEENYRLINDALSGGNKTAAIKLIKSRYLAGAPATFVTPPEDRKNGYLEQGDPANGKLMYELSCKHCHEKARYSFFRLDDSKATFKYLLRHLPKYTRYSIYQVTRYGTSPMNWKRAYMPNYTLEKMNNQQLEDLRAYIEKMAR